jgi:1,4-dihydroxy-2-naphthoyl-CoA hydrolase
MDVTKDVITVMGTMHGGCLSAMCDHVLGVVMYPVMQPGYWAATTEFKINLLAPVTTGVCRATSEIIAMTRRMAVVRIEIENEARLVALAQGTCTIVAPKA